MTKLMSIILGFKKASACAMAALMLLCLPSTVSAQTPKIRNLPLDQKPIKITRDLQVPMRDGVSLLGDLYQPDGSTKRLPAIVTILPYMSDLTAEIGTYFAQGDYHFLSVNSRGRGGSGGGPFIPLEPDAKDLHDVVEWAAKQPWCDGQVALWGGSYLGYVQWVVQRERPPHLKTMVPTASVHPGIDFPMRNNITYPYLMRWLSYTSGTLGRDRAFGFEELWNEYYRRHYVQLLPFQQLDQTINQNSAIFQKWMQHPYLDEYWDSLVPRDSDYAAIDFPILSITGYYDDDQPGALAYYQNHMKHGTNSAKKQHYLVIGPWDHGGTRRPKAETGGMKFGPASVMDVNRLHLDWYNWVLKKGKFPEFLAKRVAYYKVGPEAWDYADRLEDVSGAPERYYLQSQQSPTQIFKAGQLARSARDFPTARYTYDPKDVRSAAWQAQVTEIGEYVDHRPVMAINGDGLVYHTDALPEDRVLAGTMKLGLHLSMNVKDTDIAADLYEVKPDGTQIRLGDTTIRARYRQSLRKPVLVTPGETQLYTLESRLMNYRTIGKGSFLRLVIYSPNNIHDQKNYNGGGVVAEESGKDAQTAIINLHQAGQESSYIDIPWRKPASR